MYTVLFICIYFVHLYTYIHVSIGGCGPSGGASDLNQLLREVGLALPTRSLLRPTDMMIEEKGNHPGEFALHIKRTRRNSKDVTLDDQVFNQIAQCSRGLAIQKPTERTAVRLEKGVKLNGRPVSRGDVCALSRRVNRLHSELAGEEAAQGVCTVRCFYQIKCGDSFEVFADVILVDTSHKMRSMFIMAKDSVGLDGVAHTFIHVDMIIAKLHVAPHFDDITLVCAIPMWHTR